MKVTADKATSLENDNEWLRIMFATKLADVMPLSDISQAIGNQPRMPISRRVPGKQSVKM